jgi:hypothetical protein
MTPSEPLYRLIPLTQGQWAVVDAADYDWLMQWKWCTRSFYALRHLPTVNGKRCTTSMHRQILGMAVGDRRRGDHKSHNTLDNRRGNLRDASAIQNCQNQQVRSDNTTGCKGVCVYKGRCYRAKISVNGVEYHLGYFDLTPAGLRAAKAAYDFAADFYFGEFAFLGPTPVDFCGSESSQERRRLQRPNKTGRRGVNVHHGIKYRSKIWVNGKVKHLGYFPLTSEGLKRAALVYEFAKDLYHVRVCK